MAMSARSRSRGSVSCAIRSPMKKPVESARRRTVDRKWCGGRGWLVAAFCLAIATASPALAEEPVRIGLGFGLAFLPVYICEDLKLVEKYGKESHLDVRVSYQ